ncbi:MAG: hypothetical protein HW408_10 [Actinobacteria bacterium]|nr:hypothetical protein [Actinomycetota bacterium]
MGRRLLSGAASACFVASALVLATGCASGLHRLAGEEARGARELFASAAAVTFPIETSFTGVAEVSGGVFPFVAGVNSRTPSEETVGFYDPLGRPVMFLTNDGIYVTVSRGLAAGKFPPPDFPPVPAGPVSLGRILSGAPAYTLDEGDPWRTQDGEWVLEDRRQRLFSDSSRRLLVRAEYVFAGKDVAVSYPGRELPGPPPVVNIEISGAKIIFRRDTE